MSIKYFAVTVLMLLVMVISTCTTNKVLLAPTAQEQFEIAKEDYDEENYLNAIEGFQKTIFNFPGATIVDTAQYYLAMSYYQNEEYELAAVEFNRLILNYPRSDFADDAQYMVGVSRMENAPGHYALDQGDLRKAISSLQDFIIDNPDSPLVEEAQTRIDDAQNKLAHKAFENGMTYFKMYAYEASRVYFQFVLDEYTNTEYAPEALFRMGEAFYKQKLYTEAEEKFNQFLGLYPEHELISKVDKYLAEISKKVAEENVSAETN